MTGIGAAGEGALDWTSPHDALAWRVVIGAKAKARGTRARDAATALTWVADAPDEESARAMALEDARRAFAVTAVLRGRKTAFPEGAWEILSCKEDEAGEAPSLKIGRAMERSVGAPRRRRAQWEDKEIEAAATAAFRCAAGKASLPAGRGVCAIYGDEGKASRNGMVNFGVVTRSVTHKPDGTYLGEPNEDLPIPGPLRAALIAIAIVLKAAADAAGCTSEGTAPLAVPESATMRAAMRADLNSTRATDAARVARFLEKAGLHHDAAEFLAAFGA